MKKSNNKYLTHEHLIDIRYVIIFIFCSLLINTKIEAQNWVERAAAFPDSNKVDINDALFGNAMDIDGDYAIIGSPNENNSTGGAYIYKRTDKSWTNIARLSPSDGVGGDRFGKSVAIHKDFVAIGSPQHDTNGNFEQGAVYIFERPETGWSDAQEDIKLSSEDGGVLDVFGSSIDACENMIVVGANRKSIGDNIDQGVIYIFKKIGQNWRQGIEQSTILKASDGSREDFFGSNVVLRDSTLIVTGVRRKDIGDSNNQGAVYIYKRNSEGWFDAFETAKVTSQNLANFQYFGHDIAVWENFLLIGASGVFVEDNIFQGVAYILKSETDSWIDIEQLAKLTSSDGEAFDNFGGKVSIFGRKIAIGAPNHNLGENTDQGAVYIYEMPPTGWRDATETSKIVANDGIEDDIFGSEVELSKDWLLSSSLFRDRHSNDSKSGKVYFFNRNSIPLILDSIKDISLFPNEDISLIIPKENFTDTDGDSLKIELSLLDNNLSTWWTFDSTENSISGIPLTKDRGNYPVLLSLMDGNEGIAFDTFNIFVLNNPPVLQNSLPDTVAYVDEAFTFKLPEDTFNDLDEDTLIYSASLENKMPLPQWINFNSTSITFSGVPTLEDIDRLSVSIEVSDENGGIASETFILDVLPPLSLKKNRLFEETLSIFPNPNLGAFHVKVDNDHYGTYQINIMDTNSNLILSKKFEKTKSEINLGISLDKIPAGLYFINIIYDSKLYSFNKVLIK